MPDVDFINTSHNVSVLLGFLTALVVAAGWMYRKVLRPVHKAVMAMSDIVEAQLTPNHGSSIVDRVAQIAPNHLAAETHWKQLELSQKEIKLEVLRLTERLDLIESREDKEQ